MLSKTDKTEIAEIVLAVLDQKTAKAKPIVKAEVASAVLKRGLNAKYPDGVHIVFTAVLQGKAIKPVMIPLGSTEAERSSNLKALMNPSK